MALGVGFALAGAINCGLAFLSIAFFVVAGLSVLASDWVDV